MNTYNVGETPRSADLSDEQITITLNADTARDLVESDDHDLAPTLASFRALTDALRPALAESEPPKPLEVGMVTDIGFVLEYVNSEIAVGKLDHEWSVYRPTDSAWESGVWCGLQSGKSKRHPWPDPPVDEQKERYLEALKQIAESATWASMLKAEEVRWIIRKALEADND